MGWNGEDGGTMPDGLAGQLAVVQGLLQMAASVAVVLLAIAAWRVLRAGQSGNLVQMEVDLQVHDIGGGDQIGELLVVLHNIAPREQVITNLFVEVRPSRHVPSGTGRLVPPSNLITHEERPLVLPARLRHTMGWTFEIPRDERLVRVTAAISQGDWMDADTVTVLGQKQFDQLGPTTRYLSRVFDVSAGGVSAGGFRRF